jgi:hypothetical protein
LQEGPANILFLFCDEIDSSVSRQFWFGWGNDMKYYSSFLIRCWLIEDAQHTEKKIIGVEHIQSGGQTRVATLTEAEEWMFEACRNTPSEAKAGNSE